MFGIAGAEQQQTLSVECGMQTWTGWVLLNGAKEATNSSYQANGRRFQTLSICCSFKCGRGRKLYGRSRLGEVIGAGIGRT